MDIAMDWNTWAWINSLAATPLSENYIAGKCPAGLTGLKRNHYNSRWVQVLYPSTAETSHSISFKTWPVARNETCVGLTGVSVETDWISSVEMKVIYRRSTVRSWANWAALYSLQCFTLPRHVGATRGNSLLLQMLKDLERGFTLVKLLLLSPFKGSLRECKEPPVTSLICQALTGFVGGSLFPHSSSCRSRSHPSCPGSDAQAPHAARLGSAERQTGHSHAKNQHKFSSRIAKIWLFGCCFLWAVRKKLAVSFFTGSVVGHGSVQVFILCCSLVGEIFFAW